jgi:hypothetical protein
MVISTSEQGGLEPIGGRLGVLDHLVPGRFARDPAARIPPSPHRLAQLLGSKFVSRRLFYLALPVVAVVGIEAGSSILLRFVAPMPDLRPALKAEEARRAADRRAALAYWFEDQVLHPYLGFVQRPAGRPDSSSVTELGFPAGPLIREAQADTLVVGVFGGSVAQFFGEGSAVERAFAGLANGRRVVTVNAAIGGGKQPQSLLALAYLLSVGAHFDVVLLLDGFNEVALHPAENAAHGVSPLYPRGWAALVGGLDAAPEARRLLAVVATLSELRETIARELATSVLRRSSTAVLSARLVDRTLASMVSERRLRLLKTRVVAYDYSVRGPRWPVPGGDALYRSLAEMWVQSAVQMERLCRANDIRFVHVLQPNQYAGAKPMGPAERRAAWLEDQPYYEPARRGYPFLREASVLLEDVEFFDLTAVFDGISEPLYVDTCCHFNARGNEVLAEAIAARLRPQ